MYNDKYTKTKTKIYNNFFGNKIPEDNEYCACLSVILLDAIFVNANKECYPQIIQIYNTSNINEELKLDESDDDEFDED